MCDTVTLLSGPPPVDPDKVALQDELTRARAEIDRLRRDHERLIADNWTQKALLLRVKAEREEPGHVTKAEIDQALNVHPTTG